MMRQQVLNPSQSPGSIDQKKSVFERLGRQVDARQQMKRRPSPGPYGEYLPPPPMHEGDFGRYGRDPHAELEWRYQHERRLMPPFPRDRHPQQLPPPPPPPPMGHYDIDIGGRQPPYYPHLNPYHAPQPGLPPPPLMVPGNMPMAMHQQRSSPKYDRHGNPFQGYKDRGGPMRMGPMDHHPGMSPPRTFMPPGPMMHGPHDMPPMRPGGIYPPPRWQDNMEPEFPMHGGRIIQDGRSSPPGAHRYQQPQIQPQQQQQLLKPQPLVHLEQPGDVPRYTKWRERRDVIINLDRETAQSSSRTDSLKSSLQQADNRPKFDSSLSEIAHNKSGPVGNRQSTELSKKNGPSDTQSTTSTKDSSNTDLSKPKRATKTDPQDISDGEIVDDEDSSDDSESVRTAGRVGTAVEADYLSRSKQAPASFGRNREAHQYYESPANKKKRILEREDYSMDYETISDEDLDDFMGDKKITDIVHDDKLTEGAKSLSEVELLNALGLDWANLVEMAKQSKSSSKETYAPGTALSRFSIQNYLPTLGITEDLAGPELFDLLLRVSRP